MRTRPSLPRRGSTPASEWDAAGLRGRHSSVALLALIGVGLALLLWQAASSGNPAGLVPGAGAAAGPAQEACEAAGMTWLPEAGLCTHGPDPAPPGVDPTRRVSPIGEFTEAGLAPSPLAVCDGDGVSGKRVQVLYVHASDVPSQFNRYVASFRQWSADTSQIYTNSARETGGNRYVRFVHDATCVIDVRSVTVAPAEDDSFGAMASAVSRQGHNRADRKYLMYADITDPYVCGVGSSPPDDRPGADNESNLRAGYTVVYAGCWANGTTAAHELGHNLGAVQLSAPNSSGGGHCTDEWDVMCYSDSPNFPAMRFRCTARDSSLSLDCNKDDYYHTNPGAGSYLATHWNVASSAFLGRTAGPATTRPANDDFANATAIGAVPYTSRIDTANATTAADEPIDTRQNYCGNFLSRTVWYRFTAPATATYEFDTAGSDYRLVLAAFTGSRGSLVQADCDTTDVDDLNRPVRQPVIGQTLTAGTTLYVAVGAHFSPRGGAQTPGGNLVLNVTSYTNQDPEVVFVAPTEGATVSGVVPIRVRATDDRDAPGTLLVFYEDDITSDLTFLEYNAANGTYDGSWDARAVATGARTLTAWVNDSVRAVGRASITVTLASPGPDTVAPAVAISAPAAGATIANGATVAATASDDVGVTRVEFRYCPGSSCEWSAGTAIGSRDTTAPYAVVWSGQPADGPYTLLAQARDAAGNVGTSNPVTVSVVNTRPTIALAPTQGKYNDTVTAQLSGFQANGRVTLRWDRATTLATVTADAAGRATARFRVPGAVYGTHAVEAKDATGRTATASFRIIPRLALTPATGPSGTVVRVDLYGFAARERVEVRFYDTAGRTYKVLRTLTTGSTGRAGGSVTIPARTPLGVHRVVARVVGGSRSAAANFRVTAGAASGTEKTEPVATATAVPPPTEPTAAPTPIAAEPIVATPTPTEPPAPPAELPAEPTAVAAPTEVPTPVPPPEAPADSAEEATD